MTGIATILRGDARALPLADASVDLIVTSPPYWGLRSYTDCGQHYMGQIGDEPTPHEYIETLVECTAEWVRVLKPTGSLFVNLGDVFANTATSERVGSSDRATSRADRPGRKTSAGTGVRPKSLYGLPWRYALACIDDLGLILRRDQIWYKVSALPESVTDRCATRHEYVFHFTVSGRYYAAVDRIREPHTGNAHDRGRRASTQTWTSGDGVRHRTAHGSPRDFHPLGKLPGSVWSIAGEPLTPPEHVAVDHYAAFPSALPRRIVDGWSPSGVCTACGEGRRPVVERGKVPDRPGRVQNRTVDALIGGHGPDGRAGSRYSAVSVVIGEACACPDASAPTRPAVVLDPFGGSGTTALVAKALGRHGISVDRSADYCRLAEWRITDPGQLAKALGVPKPPVQIAGQGDLFAGLAS